MKRLDIFFEQDNNDKSDVHFLLNDAHEKKLLPHHRNQIFGWAFEVNFLLASVHNGQKKKKRIEWNRTMSIFLFNYLPICPFKFHPYFFTPTPQTCFIKLAHFFCCAFKTFIKKSKFKYKRHFDNTEWLFMNVRDIAKRPLGKL